MKAVSKLTKTSVGNVFVNLQPAKTGRSGPLVVLLHGWGSSSGVWKDQVASCPQATLTVDLPGFGKSPEPETALTVPDYATAVEEVVDMCGDKEVVLVGHSFGGQVAAELAARQPSWLSGLVLVASASVRKEHRPLLSKVGSFLSPVFRLPLLRRLRPAIYNIIGADIPPESPVMRATMRNILCTDQRHRLDEVTVPTQLVWGDADTATPLTDGKVVADHIEKSQLTVLAGGHFIFLDQPTAFADILRSFINQIF